MTYIFKLMLGGFLLISSTQSLSAMQWNASQLHCMAATYIKNYKKFISYIKEDIREECYNRLLENMKAKNLTVGEVYYSKVHRNKFGYLADTWVAVGIERFAFDAFEPDTYEKLLDGFKIIRITDPSSGQFGNSIDTLSTPENMNVSNYPHSRTPAFNYYNGQVKRPQIPIGYFWYEIDKTTGERTRRSIDVKPCSRILAKNTERQSNGKLNVTERPRLSTECIAVDIDWYNRATRQGEKAHIIYHRLASMTDQSAS